jgi:hypothetical protein
VDSCQCTGCAATVAAHTSSGPHLATDLPRVRCLWLYHHAMAPWVVPCLMATHLMLLSDLHALCFLGLCLRCAGADGVCRGQLQGQHACTSCLLRGCRRVAPNGVDARGSGHTTAWTALKNC